MKLTLLEMVQDILSSMDSDEVNSITDSTEALQVARIIRDSYIEITDRLEAEEMLWDIKGCELLKGARGRGGADVGGIIDILLKVSALCTDLGDLIAEIDLNPVIVFENGAGAKVIDALIVKETVKTQ